MPGVVVRVLVSPGERVEAREPLVVLEAMKMETPLSAPSGGVVTVVRVSEGDRVTAGQPLVHLDR
jgi:biotin carboxyl carrier protein